MTVAIIDYGVGNLRSISNSFTHVAGPLNIEVAILDRARCLTGFSALVLPGQGAFGSSVDNVRNKGWEEPILEAVAEEVPLFGICVGMQLLLDESEEMGRHRGLGLIPGQVLRFPDAMADPQEPTRMLRVPQIGWNQLHQQRSDPLLDGVPTMPMPISPTRTAACPPTSPWSWPRPTTACPMPACCKPAIFGASSATPKRASRSAFGS